MEKKVLLLITSAALLFVFNVEAQEKKPNILVIFGDDVGLTNISAYGNGVVGHQTPNLDKLASEGIKFTDYYAENSCTAGRSTFITGQSVKRTGMSKVGIPGAPVGLTARDMTIAQALKPLGYATGQFGKNHLGDLDEYLPTNHGFDEFFGNLYHLNAEEEPENPNFPKEQDDPQFTKSYKPRGVLHTYANGKIEDTGPLDKKRMETIDDETTSACIEWMKKQSKEGKPFFSWMNFTRMHVFTHVRASMRGQSGMPDNEYADGMIEMDMNVGKLMKALEEMGIANNTIVIFTTDNGPNQFSWPDAASTPFRSEKNTNWEGAYRVPAFIRWPGQIKPNTVSNQMFSGLDWFPTLLAAAGNKTLKDDLLKGASIAGKKWQLHLDGFNQLEYLTGKTNKSSRTEFAYFNDDAQLVGYRYNDWKIVIREQPAPGGFSVWRDPFTTYRVPLLFNLRMDPFERAAIASDQYDAWQFKNAFIIGQVVFHSVAFLETFIKYPPSQLPATFSPNEIEAEIDRINGAKLKPHSVTRE
ncbi:MAG: arylsulfatase [Flavobacterium sp.]|nr:MAG: arylsulfatase [Flavobacterium sp.]